MTDLPKPDSSCDNARIFEGLDHGNSMGFQDLFDRVASLDLVGGPIIESHIFEGLDLGNSMGFQALFEGLDLGNSTVLVA